MTAIRRRWIKTAGAALSCRNDPTPLVRNGTYLDDALRRQRVTRAEVLAAARSSGNGDIDQLDAVILETDGSISILTKRH